MEGGLAMAEGDNRMMDKELSQLRYLYARSLLEYILWANLIVGREMMFVEMNPMQCLVCCIVSCSFLAMHH